MIVKNEFELIYKSTGKVYNIVPLSKSTLSAYEISNDDFNHLVSLVKTFNRIKPNIASSVVESQINDIMVVNLHDYPLPGFISREGIGVVNISVLPSVYVTDFSTTEVFALFLYTVALKGFINKRNFKVGMEIPVIEMLFSTFMKFFGKESGLIGSFRGLIPKLRFLINLYVYVSMAGYPLTETLKKKIGAKLYINPSELKLDGYDFSSIKDFLQCINDNEIISISENKFSSKMISRVGMSSLPLFEDFSRFYATIIASNVPGNSQFSFVWRKINVNLYQKIIDIGMKELGRM